MLDRLFEYFSSEAARKEEFIHTKKLAVLIGNSLYSDIGDPDLEEVQEELDFVKTNLKTLLNFEDEEIHTLYEAKRIDTDKSLGKLKQEIDEANEQDLHHLVFVYYVGRCAIDDGKFHTVHGADSSERKKHFAIEGWMKELQGMGAFIVSLFDCYQMNDQKGWEWQMKNSLRLEKQCIMVAGWGKPAEIVSFKKRQS